YIVHLESLKLGLQGMKKPGRHIGVVMILILFLTGFIGMAALTCLIIGFRAMREPMMPGATVYPALVLLVVAYLALLYVASKYPDIEIDDPNSKAVTAPRLTPTFLGGAYYALPIFVLVWNLMVRTEYLDRLSPALSAFWATIAMIIVAMTHRPIKAIFRGENQTANEFVAGFGDFVAGLESGARNMIGIGVATGAAGIIVGTISLTGAHQIIGQVIEVISGGNLIILLLLVALLSLILGMGLPTTANYIVVSSLMAPVIVSVGAQSGLIVPLIAVHMFVFYFGILADDTPPVGLAAYAAAAISRGDPIKTGIVGFSYDIRTALLPFMFIFNTDLLLIDVSAGKAVVVFFVSLIAMLVFAAVTQGYFIAKSRKWEGAVLLVAVFMLFRPDFFLDQWQEKYTEVTGPAALTAIEELPIGSTARLRVSAPDFDTGIVGSITLNYTPESDGSATERLDAVGLTVIESDGILTLDEPFPGTTYFEKLGNDYDFYGDEPAKLEAVEIENERIAKEIFWIPGLVLIMLIAALQSPRKTQPAF
ncbi:MAG: DUF3394 domain-containing protein, partial [Pseudomonadota bacterium]